MEKIGKFLFVFYIITLLIHIYRIWRGSRKYTNEKDSEKTTPNSPSKPISNLTPMDQPVPGLPVPIYASLKEEHQSTQITKLSNGLTVASENRFGEYCTVGGIQYFTALCY